MVLIDERLKKLDKATVNREYEGAIVMAKYGPHRTYKVHSIRWDMTPETYFFNEGDLEKKTNML